MALKNPILSNPIAVDIPKLNEILDALSKANPTDVDGISTGAMRLYEVSSGKWQWQVYNGSTWASVPFLQHNIDQLDGYHAAITPAANTVAVRNSSGLLQDSITGNAATASSAATLSQTLPVNKGGTGATTSEAARANLGVPPTSHTSTATTYGVGNATQYGHLKLSDAVDSASGATGGTAATPAAVKAAKEAADVAQSAADAAQSAADAAMTKASTLATDSTPGISKPGTGMTVDAAGSLNVNTSSASNPGIVKSSTTAQVGAVPLGGADGTLGEDWLKKAMDAAAAAQKTADDAKQAANRKPEITVLSTRTSSGGTENWTITGVDTTSPLYITHKTTTTSVEVQGVFIHGASGIADGPQSLNHPFSSYALSYTTPGGKDSIAGDILLLRPTNSTVVLKLRWMAAYGALTAWQYK